MAKVFWPREALPAQAYSFNISPRTLRGPTSIDGLSQVASSDAGVWTASMMGMPVTQWNGRRRIELWHALAGLVEGRLNSLIVPVPSYGRRPLPDGVTDSDIDTCGDGLPFSDDSYFSDDVGHETGWIEASIGAGAARRATTLSITKSVCGAIAPGMRFCVNLEDYDNSPVRLYQVKSVSSQTDGSASIGIWPPLREALASGVRTEWVRPYVQMRLSSDNEMDLRVARGGLAEFPTINLIEDL